MIFFLSLLQERTNLIAGFFTVTLAQHLQIDDQTFVNTYWIDLYCLETVFALFWTF